MTSAPYSGAEALSPSSPIGQNTYKFPPFSHDALPTHYENPTGYPSSRDTSPNPGTQLNGGVANERWTPRRNSNVRWGNGAAVHGGGRHGRQKSLSEAIRTIKGRRASVSANAHEIADALKPPISPKLIFLCGIWYATSILSNTSSKAILTAFPKPITLTLVQFAFVSSWCFILAWLAKYYPSLKVMIPALKFGIRPPSRDLILTTLPLTAFQIGGHILSSDAMARIPVSLVHTIKGLSPLLTVIAYRAFLRVRYSVPTYLSLIPLTLGVIMACSANFSANFLGLLFAFGSAILFVTQNIVSKKLFNEAAQAEADGVQHRYTKPDKLNLLCYSSGLAFVFTAPLWLWSEGFGLMADFLHDASIDLSNRPGSLDHGRLALEYVFNGTFHFGQNLVAFILLSMVSPVTYSVASLIKRVFVIAFAIVWYGNNMTHIQAVGFVLTFFGLYLYDRTSDASKADRKAKALQAREGAALLPIVTEHSSSQGFTASPMNSTSGQYNPTNGSVDYYSRDEKKNDTEPGKPRRDSSTGWLTRGTKQEDTWKPRDMNEQRGITVS
ncbi:TPT-domain-containing protein [Patellaria atrata CBS 101060]|uniref:TPT-domain-containing protein n=1 Tax=Patellaria atrata CBS 101060 TaxID=1346257 RepID=A0A9P4VSB2_9PEZI|nr:TPT-domain-containing protein [Patellaria atrata CBS 101060]